MARAGFRHAFTTRLGGVSPAPFDSLDFALGRGQSGSLAENQARLARAVGFDPSRLHQAVQVHGRALLVADGDPRSMLALEADAFVAEPGTEHAVAVRVADCVPVLVADPASGRVAAAHAGWRGVEAGVVPATLRKMAESAGSGPSAGFLAAIGPCIGPCCFEVSAEVGQRIVAVSTERAIARRYEAGGGAPKMRIDLRAAVRAQLEALGLVPEAIDDVPSRGPDGCTRCDSERFYSFRRDADASGRLLGVIVAGG